MQENTSSLSPIASVRDKIKRWWQHKGFGIESRTDYDFLHDVIREKIPYYIYKDMQRLYPDATVREQRLAQLLFRLGNYMRPDEIVYYGMTTSLYRYALDHTRRQQPSDNQQPHTTLTFIQGEPATGVSTALWTSSMILVTDIHSCNKSLWQTIVQREHTITFDTTSLGIAIIDRKRFPAHYNI